MPGRLLASSAFALVAFSACTGASAPARPTAPASREGSAKRCTALGAGLPVAWPDAGTRVLSAAHVDAGPAPAPPGPPGVSMPGVTLPAHCEIKGILHERTGVGGQHYAIRFHLRLPDRWNGRFFMQGGGGTNGELGDAIGRLQGGAEPALTQGYAVLSQDSGHDNATNTVPEHGGQSAFGFDPQARADYGGDSLEASTLAAKAVVKAYYGSEPSHSYFVGCSKGGQEGMALAQQYPTLYDGIVAGAPGFSLPRAAIGEAWNTQAFASVVKAEGKAVTPASLAASFSQADFGLVRAAVLNACDADDGLTDGIVGNFRQCTSAKVVSQLKARECRAGKQDGCLSAVQVGALEAIHRGAHTSAGKQIYPGFTWDAGWADIGWRIWMIGAPDASMPSINIAMGGPSLAAIFASPPQAFADPADNLHYVLNYDFDRDPQSIYAIVPPFTRSAWQDISARSGNLDRFRARGGKLIVPQGVSDPVFSINDTLAWWGEVNARYAGKAAAFTRVFPVPGMGHCQGGPATDQFDAFAAVVRWVEQAKAPDSIAAKAGPSSPWPGRERPLCPFPLVAQAVQGKGGATTFACRKA